MQKKHMKKYSNLYKHFPLLFPKKCSNCGNDFIRESGWRAITSPIINNMGITRYLCNNCAPDFAIANTYFLENKWVGPRPSYSPGGINRIK